MDTVKAATLLAEAACKALGRVKGKVFAFAGNMTQVVLIPKPMTRYQPTLVTNKLQSALASFMVPGENGGDVGVEDLQLKKIKLALPFGRKGELVTVTVVFVELSGSEEEPSEQTTMFSVTCSTETLAIEVRQLA